MSLRLSCHQYLLLPSFGGLLGKTCKFLCIEHNREPELHCHKRRVGYHTWFHLCLPIFYLTSYIVFNRAEKGIEPLYIFQDLMSNSDLVSWTRFYYTQTDLTIGSQLENASIAQLEQISDNLDLSIIHNLGFSPVY